VYVAVLSDSYLECGCVEYGCVATLSLIPLTLISSVAAWSVAVLPRPVVAVFGNGIKVVPLSSTQPHSLLGKRDKSGALPLCVCVYV